MRSQFLRRGQEYSDLPISLLPAKATRRVGDGVAMEESKLHAVSPSGESWTSGRFAREMVDVEGVN